MRTVIKVENISKSYLLHHRQRESYVALRDVIANRVKSIFSSGHKSQKATDELFWALKGVSFDVKDGERVGIIGRNGAGKSTLLKILSRITEPTAGKVSLKGRVASLLEVGTGFHPELTGRENIFLNGSILGMSKTEIRKKFDEIVDFAEVEKFLDTPVKRYSSGMYVRLAFAVAAHLEPEILIVDEVLAVGDAQFQRKCLGKMQDVSKNDGRTVLFVSHNMQAVQKLCTTGILLQQGKIIGIGGIDNVVNKYLEANENGQSVYEIALPDNHEEIPGYAYRVRIEDENSNPVLEIPVGNNWQVRVYFRLHKMTEQFIIALGVVTSLDLPLRTSWSESKDYHEGEYEAVFKNNDILFANGMYKLVIGLSSNRRAFHYIENAARLTISDVSSIVNNNQVLNTQSGLLLNPMEITITEK